MLNDRPNQFTREHVILDDGAVMFRCSSDVDQWPWLALDPFDPIVVQSINFHAASEASHKRGAVDPKSWTALTESEWICSDKNVGHATHGVAEATGADGQPGFTMTFFDKAGAFVYRMGGTGVIFQNRDFEAWRKTEKQKIATPTIAEDFIYADTTSLGVSAQNECFISPLSDRNQPTAQALITSDNGFPPAQPYLSGSGDHVNSTHLADVARQFANLLHDGASLSFTGGKMTFTRYVELGYPFRLTLVDDQPTTNAISMAVDQAERPCATINLQFRNS